MKHMKKIMIAALCLPLFWVTGCKSIPSYAEDYANARQTTTGKMMNDADALEIGQRFTAAFNQLGTDQFIDQVSQLYADRLFINDTLSQFSAKENLVEHFKGMNNRVSNTEVTLLNTAYAQDSAYVHWRMAYDFKIFGQTRSMMSHGMSEIKVNDQNQIIFQQDFWDPADGLYRSLPYMKGVYAWLLPFKKSQ